MTNEQAPSNELRLSDERIAKLIELWSDTTNPGSMWSDAVLALHELSNRRAADKMRSAHEPCALPNTPTNLAQARRDAERLIDTDRHAAIDAIVRAAQPPGEDARDAVRYRWLRENGNSFFNACHYRGKGDAFDAQVDSALTKEGASESQ
jgi:hypothetical protein